MKNKLENIQNNVTKIISLAEEEQGSEIYISIKLVLLDTLVNKNNVQYSPEFLKDIADRKQDFLAIPLMAEVSKLENGKYDNLTHAYNQKTGKFKSQMIGSFVDFYTQESPNNKDVLELVGECRVPKRFEKTTEALQELYDNKNLNFSYEIACGEYSSINGIKYVDKSDKNFLFAMAVVTNQAVESATALTLVAAIEEDFNILEGGGVVPGERNKETFTQEEMFKNTKVHLSTEIAELDLNQVRRKMYAALKKLLGDNYWNYDVIDQTMEYIIVSDYSSGDYFKIEYTVNELDVALSNMRAVTKTYQDIQSKQVTPCPNCDPNNPMCQQCEMKDNMEESDMAECKKNETKMAELEAQIASLNTTIAEKDTVLATKETEIAEKSTQLETLSASVIEKDKLLAELEPIKTEHEALLAHKAEEKLVADRTALKEKYAKLLSAEVLAKVEIAEAIENLNESVLKDAVIEVALASASQTTTNTKVETASRITDNVSIGKNDLVSKYVTVAE